MEYENTNETLIDILTNILETESYSNISINLNVAIGTIKRWIELNKIPTSYTFDLMKLSNKTR